ncbi:hypothetical protein CLAIMM_14545 [Cladophialophora immunda]|nr:hypothetical protein CLAIMM_14545 [Cladophialophora immunda]
MSNAWMSQVDPGFESLIPGLRETFRKIWTFEDINEFRENWSIIRGQYPTYVPSEGFDISYRTKRVRDGTPIELRVYRPSGAVQTERLPLLFVLHGGGFVAGNHDTENSMCRSVCVKNRMVVISIDFRKAPEFQFPVPCNDAYDVYLGLLEDAESFGFDPSKAILAGSSAGSSLTAGLALRLTKDGRSSGVIGQMLNIPALCHPDHLPRDKFELNSYEQNASAPTIDAPSMRWYWKQYCPDSGFDPLASPLLAPSLSGLPPALIQVAGMDPMRDEGIAYAAALSSAGVPVDLKVYPGLPHGFLIASHLPVVNQYLEAMVEWVSKILKASEKPRLS